MIYHRTISTESFSFNSGPLTTCSTTFPLRRSTGDFFWIISEIMKSSAVLILNTCPSSLYCIEISKLHDLKKTNKKTRTSSLKVNVVVQNYLLSKPIVLLVFSCVNLWKLPWEVFVTNGGEAHRLVTGGLGWTGRTGRNGVLTTKGHEWYVTPGGYRGRDWALFKKLNALYNGDGIISVHVMMQNILYVIRIVNLLISIS